LLANKIAQITFTITQDSMVNLWVNQSDITSTELFVKDIDIRLTGGNDDVSVDYSSDKGGGAGESVSSVLPAGTYSLFITDNTDYSQQTLLSKEEVSQLLLNVGVGININPYTTQKIEGRISIPESGESMPVSMGVAEFEPREDGTWRRKESDEVSSLNPNKPVWVVVHGRGDSEQGNNINYLAQCLSLQGYQVVTLDWEDAADDNDLTIGALQGANWIPAVGKWGADQLKAMRFEGNNVIDGGHSWGSLVAYEIGKNYKYGEDGNGYGVQAIVAMDSPLDALPNNYPINEVVFNDVSNVSLALHSSAFGSQSRANTADFNFDIPGINEAYENTIFMTPDKKVILDNAQAYFNEHGYSVSYFANLVKGKGDTSLDVLDIERLINGQMLDIIVDPNGPEGVLPITLQENIGPEGNYWQAIPTSLLDKP
ncbi:hypothetical protein KJ652_00870, partial [Patescibacteria group bacterium]|nr:hypothetical protein [Patescibacteria group bacterium]